MGHILLFTTLKWRFLWKNSALSDLYDSTEICTKTLICIKLCVCMFISEEHTDVLKLIRFIHKHMVGHNGVNFFRSLILNPVWHDVESKKNTHLFRASKGQLL